MEYGGCIEKPIPKMFSKLELFAYALAIVVIMLDMFVWRP
jgi:hypothetical protein